MRIKHYVRSLPLLVLLPVAVSSPAFAQDEATATESQKKGLTAKQLHSLGVEEVIVSARKKDETIQDIPLAVTPFFEGQMERRGFTGMEDIAAATPGFTYEGFITAGTNGNAVIRGLAQQFTTSRIQNVAMFIDGVYMQRQSMLNMGLLDMERVEVVKGPQNALYGRNAFAGAVNNITKRPSAEPTAYISNVIGADNRLDLKGSYAGPFMGSDTLLIKATAGLTRFDGHTKNNHPAANIDTSGPSTRGNVGGYDDKTAALAITWDPTDTLSFHVGAYHTEIERENGSGYLLSGVNAARFGLRSFEDNDLNCGLVVAPDIGNPTQAYEGFSAFCGELPAQASDVAERDVDGMVIDPRGIGAVAETDLLTFALDWEISDTLVMHYLMGYTDHNSISTAGSGAEDPTVGQMIQVNTNAAPLGCERVIVNQDGPPDCVNPTPGADSSTVSVNTTSSRPVSFLESFSHEFRFEWDLGEKIDMAFGAYYSKVKDEQWNTIFLSPLCNAENIDNCKVAYGDDISPIVSDRGPTDMTFVVAYDQGLRQHGTPNEHTRFEDDVFAFFVALNYNLTDTVKTSLEMRYTEETATIERITDAFAIRDGDIISYNIVTDRVFTFGDIGNCPEGTTADPGTARICDGIIDAEDERTFYYFTPRAIVEWSYAEGRMLYASAAKGVKAGGFNNASTASEQTYDAATNWTYEIGSKNVFFDGMLTLNSAVYLVEWDGLQGGQSPAHASLSASDITANIGEASSLGIEVESSLKLGNVFSIDMGFTYNDASYGDDVKYSPAVASFRCDQTDVCPDDGAVGGNQLARTSKVQANIGFNAHKALDNGWLLSGRIDANYQSKQFITPLNLAWVPDRTVWNASINALDSNDRWEFNIHAKNMFNEDAAANAFHIGVFNQYLVGKLAGPTYGLSTKYNFF